MKEGTNSQSGFTLIEMLIVIAVIAILAGIVITGITGFQASARDTKRIANLRSAQNLLELYFNSCGRYPGDDSCGSTSDSSYDGTAGSWDELETAVKDKLNISNFPGPPSSGGTPTAGKNFLYEINGGGTSYIIAAELEGDSSALREPFTKPAGFNVSCSNGGSGDSETNTFCITSE